MEYRIFEAEHNSLKYRIEEDYPEIGAYLWVFKDGKDIMDYLQNDISICKSFALKHFGVPLDVWKEIKSD
jgi:hypothetical protein